VTEVLTRVTEVYAAKWLAISRIARRWDGGAGGVRTRDLLDAIEARSQLRYGPTLNATVNL
jgi:hypothetical protein